MKDRNLTKSILTLGLIFLMFGCAPTARTVKNHSYGADLSGLSLDSSYSPTIVYIRTGAPTFEAYNRFIVDPVIVHYDDPSMEDLDTDTVAKMQTYFRDSLIKSLREGGYEVGTKIESDTLRISLQLSGLKAPNAAVNVVASAAGPFSISVGEVTVEARFREAVSNRLDIVAVANTKGSRLFNAKPLSTWSDIKMAFAQWSKGVRESIDKAHNQ